jgi:hypothetical protein
VLWHEIGIRKDRLVTEQGKGMRSVKLTCRAGDQRCTRAEPPEATASTSLIVAMVVSPG